MRKIVAWIALAFAMVIAIVLLNRENPDIDSLNNQDGNRTKARTPLLSRDLSNSRNFKKKERNSNPPNYGNHPSGDKSVVALVKLRSDLKQRPKFQLMDDDGRLTSQAAASQNMTEDEVKLIQNHCDDFQVAMRELVKKNLIRVEDLEIGQVVEAYRLKPFAPEGEGAMSRFIDNLSRVIDSERAWELVKSVPVERLAGQFGTYEVLLKVVKPPDDIMNSKSIDSAGLAKLYVMQTETRDAESGALLEKNSGYIGILDRNFFNVLSYE
jgi:hypothetical protein